MTCDFILFINPTGVSTKLNQEPSFYHYLISFGYALFIGIVSGIVASTLFFRILYSMQPKIRIASEISIHEFNDGTLRGIKIINDSKKFGLIDVRAELFFKNPMGVQGGVNRRLVDIPLRINKISYVHPFDSKDVKEANYAIVFAIRDNFEDQWNQVGQEVLFRIHVKHPFSGFSKSFEQSFHTKEHCLKKGTYTFGNSFVIC